MPAVGIDLSYHSLRAVELIQRRGSLSLGRVVTRSIPKGAIYSENIEANEELKKVLVDLRKEFGFSLVRATLPEDKAYIFKITLPNVPYAQLREAITFQLEENIPLSPDEVVFDYAVLPQSVPDAQAIVQNVEVVVAAFPKKVVEGYVQLFESAGLVPVAFHLNADAIARSAVQEGDMGTYLITNLGTMSTGIYVVSQGVVQFTSTLSFGGQSLTQAIEKHLKVSHEEAIRIKRGEVMLKSREAMELFYSLANTASALRDEMNRIVSFWQNHRDKNGQVGKPIEKIYLCGSGAHLAGFDEYISTTMKIESEVVNVWKNAFTFEQMIPSISRADSLSYASAIGAALPANPHV